MRITVALFVLGIVAATALAAEERPSTLLLIHRLASRNQPANPNREWRTDFPDTYDEAAQEVVDQSFNNLLNRGFKAIPELIKHLHDQRYCRTYWSSLLVDTTVGEECYRLVDEISNPRVMPNFDALPPAQTKNVKGYTLRLTKEGKWRHVGLSYLTLVTIIDKTATRTSLDGWWQAFADKSLDDIHFAAINRRIAFEESLGFPAGVDKDSYLKPYYDLRTELNERLRRM